MRTLIYSLIFIIVVATIGLGGLFDHVYQDFYRDKQENVQAHDVDKTMMLEQIGEELAATLSKLEKPEMWVNNWQSTHNYQLTYAKIDDEPSPIPLPSSLIKQIINGEPLLLETDTSLALHFYVANHHALLVLNAPIGLIKTKDNTVNYVLTGIFYSLLIVLFLLWVTPLIKRLSVLRQTAIQFGKGELSQRINTSKFSYIRDIEVEFNNMAQRIDGLVADVKLLSSAVSHDLRTPLAKIRFGIDTLSEEDDPVLREKYQEKISKNIDEMTELVETLLRYARLDQAMLDIQKEPVNFSQLVTKCAAHKQENSDANNVEIEWQTAITQPQSQTQARAQKVEVLGDKSYLQILVNNILQNAINYGAHAFSETEKTQVLLCLKQEGNNIILSVEDNGKGIPESEREKILKPFIRGEQHLNTTSKKQHKGYGVGLAMVKRVLDWHQGHIEISDAITLSGARFTISIPVK